jgi:hypothetical protein
MIKFLPVSINDHDLILGKDFNSKFAKEMKEYYKPFVKKKRDIQVAKETWEYGVTDSIDGAIWAGSGHSVIDVKTVNADIDVKGLSTNDMTQYKLTTEASFLQNNKQQTDNFVKLFENKNYKELKEMFVDPLLIKHKDINNLHLFAIIREKDTHKVYYCLLKVDKSTLSDKDFISQMSPNGKRSVTVPMIDSTYGETYLYIPKRRLELRLNVQGLKPFLVYSHSY